MNSTAADEHTALDWHQNRAIKVNKVIIDGVSYMVIALAPVNSKEHPQETASDKIRHLLTES